MSARLDGVYQSETYNEPTNVYFNRIDQRTLYNARLAYVSGSGEWETALEGVNLTAEVYYHSIFGRGADRAAGMPDRGRQWTFSVQRVF